jgi:hypothetical protein
MEHFAMMFVARTRRGMPCQTFFMAELTSAAQIPEIVKLEDAFVPYAWSADCHKLNSAI